MANFVALATANQWAAQRPGIDVPGQDLWQVPPIPVSGGSPPADILKALSMLGMTHILMESWGGSGCEFTHLCAQAEIGCM